MQMAKPVSPKIWERDEAEKAVEYMALLLRDISHCLRRLFDKLTCIVKEPNAAKEASFLRADLLRYSKEIESAGCILRNPGGHIEVRFPALNDGKPGYWAFSLETETLGDWYPSKVISSAQKNNIFF